MPRRSRREYDPYAISRLVVNAVSELEFEGLKLEYSERDGLSRTWRLTDPEIIDRRARVIVTSETLEGLAARFNERKKRIAKLPFKRQHVIVFSGYSEPWTGIVTSRPSHGTLIIRRDDSSDGKGGNERVRLEESCGPHERVYLFSDKAFEALCNMKLGEAEFRRRKAQGLKAIESTLEAFVPDEKDHPVIE